MTDAQDLMRQINRAGSRMDPGLSDHDVERLVGGARSRRRSRTRRRLLGVATVAALGLAWVLIVQRGQPRPQIAVSATPAPKPAPSEHRLDLADGSTAVALEAATEMAVVEQSAKRVGLALNHGRARFEVRPQVDRAFVVRSGEVTVTVVGTVFTVGRVADRVGVSVERGSVHVDWGVGSALLRQGESGWYPPLVVRADAEPRAERTSSTRTRPARLHREDPGPAAPTGGAPQGAEQLLQAADEARLRGNAEQGVIILRRLLAEHRGDGRAPLAAFTLGRILLIELGRPEEAATAFAEVRHLSPRGPFAEDALAREVEAWGKAGRRAQAHERAQEYLRLYPDGNWAAKVRAIGGPE